jgi:hypothetical protein
MKWQAPEIEVTIGEKTRLGTVRKMEVVAARNQPVATAYLELSNVRFEWNDGAKDGDKLGLKWGWRGEQLSSLFDGTVLRAHLQETLQVWGLCRARQLVDTRTTRTYQNEEARAIVEHLLSGMEFASLDLVDCQDILDKLPLFDNTVVEAITFLNRRLCFEHDFYCDPSGGFHWGPRDETKNPVATFTQGEDVIEWKALPGNRYLLTVMGTPVWHSQVVAILDREGTEKHYFCDQVRHTAGIDGAGTRSQLWLSEVADG